jgi:thiamine biosynthesis protein ThiI
MGTAKYVANISAGLDSPVAVHLMLARGAEVTMLHFDNRPYSDDREVEKARRIVDRLRELHGEVPAFLVPHGTTFHAVMRERPPDRLHCVLCKRLMLRVASRYGRSIGATGVVTGESLGQVASQTLQNLAVEQQALEGLTAVRPLIGFDKTEVMAIAREIGTYDLSIAPGTACTEAPNRPSVAARSVDVGVVEREIDVDRLVEAALGGMVEW